MKVIGLSAGMTFRRFLLLLLQRDIIIIIIIIIIIMHFFYLIALDQISSGIKSNFSLRSSLYSDEILIFVKFVSTKLIFIVFITFIFFIDDWQF